MDVRRPAAAVTALRVVRINPASSDRSFTTTQNGAEFTAPFFIYLLSIGGPIEILWVEGRLIAGDQMIGSRTRKRWRAIAAF